jgi:hypothetical protein
MRFAVVGDTVIGGSWQGRDALRDWPWRTRVAVRLIVEGTLADGTAYRNNATQWLTLSWGRMTDDWVLEDTKVVEAGLGPGNSGNPA